MDPFLLISGALALLGGGAAGLAWYRNKNGWPLSAAATQAIDPLGTTIGAAAGDIFGDDTTPPVAATPSPYVAPGRTTVVGYVPPAPTPTKGPTVSISLPFGLGAISGTEAHL